MLINSSSSVNPPRARAAPRAAGRGRTVVGPEWVMTHTRMLVAAAAFDARAYLPDADEGREGGDVLAATLVRVGRGVVGDRRIGQRAADDKCGTPDHRADQRVGRFDPAVAVGV